MPSLKKQLANLPKTAVKVVDAQTDQKRNLETLFLEKGFTALSDPMGDGALPSCSVCGGGFCCGDICCCCDHLCY